MQCVLAFRASRIIPAVLAIGALTACAAEPTTQLREADVSTIRLLVEPNRAEVNALSTLYSTAYVRKKQESYIDVLGPGENRLQRLEEGRGEVIIGCTGAILYQRNPALARELSAQYVAEKNETGQDPNKDKWRDLVYQKMVANLPDNLSATDPSNGVACADYTGPELPQNIVPVFRETAMNRTKRLVLNDVSGGLNAKNLNGLLKGPQDSAALTAESEKMLTEFGL